MPAILCHLTADDAFTEAFRTRLADAAGMAPSAIVEIRGLAQLALAPNAPELDPLATTEGLWIGCRRPRAVRALLAFARCTLNAAAISWLTETAEAPALADAAPIRPWFPAIDFDRCINCDQCRQFCLFGVYTKNSSGRVEVANPLSCKPGCPACARLCPTRAIIFPFCPESPINGDEPTAAGTTTENTAPAVAAISRTTLEAALARRKRAKG